MSEILPFLVIGVVTGSLYGLAAAGLVLTYRISGIFNFAHGAIGTGVAYLFYELRDLREFPAAVAFVVCVALVAPLLGVVLSGVGARLARASTARRVVATVGVMLFIQGFVQLRYGVAPRPLATSFPGGDVRVFDVIVGHDQVLTLAVSVACVVALATLFRRTQLGLQMLGSIDNAELLDLTGASPARVRMYAWMIGSAFAGLSGILLAPAVGLDAVLLTLVVVQAFGAAAIGKFRSIGLSFAGGIVIGVGAALLNAPVLRRNLPFTEGLPPLDQSLPFLVLFAVLVLTRSDVFKDRAIARPPRVTTVLPRRTGMTFAVVAGVTAAWVPHAMSTRLPILTLGAVFVIVYASLYLLVEVSGQVSLCQATFVAIGATTFSHLTAGAGLPWAFGVVGAALVAVPLGAMVAVPAIRVSGLFLALATLGFGILVEQIFYRRGFMFGAIGQRSGERPALLGLDSDVGYFYLCLCLAVAALATVVVIKRSRLGRLLNALADSPVSLATHGTNVNVARVLVFCLSAAMAGVGGALYVGVVGSVSSTGVSAAALVSFNSLLWLVVLAFVGRNALVSPVLAAVVLIVAPAFVTNPDTVQLQSLLFGAAAVLTATFADDVGRWFARQAPAGLRRVRHSPVASRHGAPPDREVAGV